MKHFDFLLFLFSNIWIYIYIFPPPSFQTSGHGGFVSSPATSGFSLASPPSLPGMNPSPAMLPHQSPSSGFLGANSPSAPQYNVASPVGFLAPSPLGPHSVPMHSPASALMQGPG